MSFALAWVGVDVAHGVDARHVGLELLGVHLQLALGHRQAPMGDGTQLGAQAQQGQHHVGRLHERRAVRTDQQHRCEASSIRFDATACAATNRICCASQAARRRATTSGAALKASRRCTSVTLAGRCGRGDVASATASAELHVVVAEHQHLLAAERALRRGPVQHLGAFEGVEANHLLLRAAEGTGRQRR
ncbi:MAG: hypothetical protein IPP44_30505 [Ideonella sp.]|nr:hypothetical protein [Ideonella sp.]